MTYRAKLRLGLLSATIFTSTAFAIPAQAEEAPAAASADLGGEIIVTGTRRSTTIMETPINISAVSSEDIERQRIDDVRDIADFTPGLTISDTGPRSTGSIVMRGLSASDVGASGVSYDDAMGIYLGEVPLYYDFKLIDLERVETLLGPQGTLYGLGTLAGAIRYIPNRPNLTEFEGQAHGRTYIKSHSGDVGYQIDGVINIPIVQDHIAFRSATGYYFDPGFIDYTLLVQEAGISLPQPDGPNTSTISQEGYDANLYAKKDVNFERTFTTRNQLLFQTTEDLKLILTYAYQQTKSDGTNSNSYGVFETGKYENASRFIEPTDRHAHLVSAEINANIADIVDLVATGAYTETAVNTSSDVTDLLLDLDYGYENYPAFAGYTESETLRKQKNAEIRFVSRHGGPFSWVLGGFYNENKYQSDYAEILPNHPWGDPVTNPDYLEYVSYVTSKVEEKAIFGEGTFQIIPQWQVTAGARYFDYSSEIAGAATLPMYNGPISPYDLDPSGGKGGEDGWVWKFNTSFNFTPDIMLFATYSKGYRIGGPNRVAPCGPEIPSDPEEYEGPQVICALPNEVQYGPDTTENLEIGTRMQLFDRKLSLNFNVFQIKWDGIQVASATTYGVTGITINGGKAKSEGFDTSFQLKPIPGLSIQGTYSYVDAKLTEDVPGIISVNSPAGTYPSAPIKIDALAGDRLPGSAKHSGSLGATYTMPLMDGELSANWTATYRGNVVSRLGWDRAYGTLIPDYTVHRASLTYDTDTYSLSLFANNIFDKYAVVSVANDLSQTGYNSGVLLRYYRQAVLNPRTVGIEGRVKF